MVAGRFVGVRVAAGVREDSGKGVDVVVGVNNMAGGIVGGIVGVSARVEMAAVVGDGRGPVGVGVAAVLTDVKIVVGEF